MMKINNITYYILIRTHLLFLFAIILSFTNTANASIDSLKQVWTNVAQPDSARFQSITEYYNKTLFSQPDSVILLTSYHFELAQQRNSQKQMAIALDRRAVAFNIKGDHGNALLEMNKVVGIYSSLNDSLALMNTYNNLALIYFERVEYKESLNYFYKCLDFYRKNKIEDIQSAVLSNIGLIYLQINNYDLALEYFNEALLFLKENGIKDRESKALIWRNIGEANLGKKDYPQAMTNCQKALKEFQSTKNEYYIANSYSFKARIYQEIDQIDSSLFYIEKGLQLHQAIGAKLLIPKDQIMLANLISATNIKRATQIGEEVLKTAGNYHDHSMKIELYNLLYKCYKKENKYSLSVDMLEKFNNYSDSLRIEQDKIAIINKAIQTEYETKIFNTQLKDEQSQSLLKLNQSLKIYSLLFFASLIILSIIFYARVRRIIQNKQKEVLLHKVSYLEEMENTHRQLIQSDKMASLGHLTAGVAHEINNPINFISNGVQGLKSTLNEYIQSPKDESTTELVGDMNNMIAAIEEGALRTNNIVKSLRLFSRVDTEDYVEADIIQGLESTFTLLSNKLMRGVFLEKHFERLELPIFCFPGQLNQVFMNILLNAIQAVEGDGTVKVKVIEQTKNIVITISDNGVGIPEDKKQRIFEPFYTTKTVLEGTGLGLSISNDIIKKHKGSIEVTDNKPKGTIFIINLPRRVASLIR